MATALTFGIELEFNVAAILDPDVGHAYASETRFVHFRAEQGDSGSPSRYRDVRPEVTHRTIARHIAQTLSNAGAKCDPDDPERKEEGYWRVTIDNSIRPPLNVDPRYTFFPIELISPPIYFLYENLPYIEGICRLLTRTYCININESCGLHVHVGHGARGFDKHFIQRLLAFLWTFEPQFNTLHSPHRHDGDHCGSLRDSSNYGFQPLVGPNLFPRKAMAGIHFLNLDSISDLIDASTGKYFRGEAYNLKNLKWWYDGTPDAKPTVEFRQHEMTLEPQRVVNWIQTVCMIVDYVLYVHPINFARLMMVGCHEVIWLEKGENLAETGYTVIRLLRDMQCSALAEYYQDKLFPLPPCERKTFEELFGFSGNGSKDERGEVESGDDSSEDDVGDKILGPERESTTSRHRTPKDKINQDQDQQQEPEPPSPTFSEAAHAVLAELWEMHLRNLAAMGQTRGKRGGMGWIPLPEPEQTRHMKWYRAMVGEDGLNVGPMQVCIKYFAGGDEDAQKGGAWVGDRFYWGVDRSSPLVL